MKDPRERLVGTKGEQRNLLGNTLGILRRNQVLKNLQGEPRFGGPFWRNQGLENLQGEPRVGEPLQKEPRVGEPLQKEPRVGEWRTFKRTMGWRKTFRRNQGLENLQGEPRVDKEPSGGTKGWRKT